MHAGLPEPVREGNGGAEGYFFSAAAARNFLAVSGECLMTRAATFAEAGGFDEALGGALWDVDYCLGRWAAGSQIVYEPGAILADTALGRRRGRVPLRLSTSCAAGARGSSTTPSTTRPPSGSDRRTTTGEAGLTAWARVYGTGRFN